MTRAEAEQEMIEGFLDGYDRDAPPPSANRSASYRHGFQSGRNDITHTISEPIAVRLQLAEQALEQDCRA